MNPTRMVVKRIGASIAAVALAVGMTMIPALSVSARIANLAVDPTTETLASFEVANGSDARLVLMRFTLEPGGSIRAHSHSGPAVFTVISGALQSDLLRGAAMVNRDGVEESAQIGDPAYLYDGDSITYSPKAGTTLANFGSEPLTLVATLLLKPNEPVFDYDYWPPSSRPHLQ